MTCVCNSFVVRWPGHLSDSVTSIVSLTSHLFTSVHASEHLVRYIVGFGTFELDSHFDRVSFKQFHCQRLGATLMKSLISCLCTLIDPMQQQAILQAWIVTFPHSRLSCLWARSQFDLSAQEFRDGLALRYKKPLLSLPSLCDGCGTPIIINFSIEHALDCRFGGLVTHRHNEVRDY